jgi:hypothetical protein
MEVQRQKETLDPFLLFSKQLLQSSSSKKEALIDTNKKDSLQSKFTNMINSSTTDVESDMSIQAKPSSNSHSTFTSDNDGNLKSVESKTNVNILPIEFAKRYEDEIAPTSKLNEYRTLGMSHRKALVAEARGMQAKFSIELAEARSVETSIHQIANLISEFTYMLQNQSGQAESLYDSAIRATELVEETDKELQLTISRSRNYSRNMTLLAIGLALFLLLLDFISP